MAFPTSPSDQQVHKEGNRAWVYDSTTKVWDQTRTPDNLTSNNSDWQYRHLGSIGSDVIFPKGHIIDMAWAKETRTLSTTARFSTGAPNSPGFEDCGRLSVSITPKSKKNLLICFGNMHGGNSSNTYGIAWRFYVSGGGGNAGAFGTGSQIDSNMGYVSTGGPAAAGTHQLYNYTAFHVLRMDDYVPRWSSGALTIKLQWGASSSGTARLNRSGSGSNNSDYTTTPSYLMVQEVQGSGTGGGVSI